MRSPNFFASIALDRVTHLRADAEWLRARMAHPDSVFLPVWRTRNLVIEGDAPRAVRFVGAAARPLIDAAGEVVLLGLFDGVAHFAIDLSHLDEPAQLPGIAAEGAFIELRNVGPLIDPNEGGALAYARAMTHWHATHRFCGSCGAPTESQEGGHIRVCTNAECARHHFPRTDPAVIMLVEKGERVLLGRKAEWAPGRYSTLAGFVEPGESLEDAVRREVMEETGVVVSDVHYHSSQPWPFPASLMLGFFCTAETETVQRNDKELEDARWFTRQELLAGDGGLGIAPRPISIARRLIDDWLNEGAATGSTKSGPTG
jgi:NAD+ diphosphatase